MKLNKGDLISGCWIFFIAMLSDSNVKQLNIARIILDRT